MMQNCWLRQRRSLQKWSATLSGLQRTRTLDRSDDRESDDSFEAARALCGFDDTQESDDSDKSEDTENESESASSSSEETDMEGDVLQWKQPVQ